MQAHPVLSADYDFNDEPLETDDVDGLNAAITRVREAGEGEEFVRCEDRVADFKVYWNAPTDSVRVGAVAVQVAYEVGGNE